MDKHDIKLLDDDQAPVLSTLDDLTAPQRAALFRKWKLNDQDMTWEDFASTVVRCGDYIMVPWCAMWIGIETDGYSHS